MSTQTLAEAIKYLDRLTVDGWDCPIVKGDKIAFVKVGYDHDTENPVSENKMYSFSRRHENYISQDDFLASIEENQDFVVLSYFEHGNCLWDVLSADFTSRHPGTEFQWDGVQNAGVWFPSQDTVKMVDDEGLEVGSKERHTRMVEIARGDCAEYTKWCNGEVYWYQILVYPLRKDEKGQVWDTVTDYRRETFDSGDSCSGLVGWDYLIEDLKETLQNIF